jgi:DNA recombination-dependent growth factor C
MGFLSGSSTIVRFLASPPPTLDREQLCRALNRRTFREHDEHGLPAAETFGWVAIHDPLVVHLEPSDVFFQQYVVLGFRYDKRTVPGKLATLERRRAEEARKKEQNLERLGRAVRREIKEEVAARLLMQALPSPGLFECAWNLETHALYFTGKSKAAKEAFSGLFRECCGVMPVPMIPYVAAERLGLPGPVVDGFRGAEPSVFAVERAREAALAAAGGES